MCAHVTANATECGTAVACHALIRAHSTWRLRGLGDVSKELITQLATAHECWAEERWLSMCVKSICVCSHESVHERKRRERCVGWMPPWHLSRSGVYLLVCTCAQSKRNNPQSHLAAMPHDEYTAKSVILTLITIPACPDVQLWQGECVCACVVCVCVCVRWAASAPSLQSSHCLRVCRMPRQQVHRDEMQAIAVWMAWQDNCAILMHGTSARLKWACSKATY